MQRIHCSNSASLNRLARDFIRTDDEYGERSPSITHSSTKIPSELVSTVRIGLQWQNVLRILLHTALVLVMVVSNLLWAAEQCLCHATPKLSRMLSSLHTRSLQAGSKLGHSLLRLQRHWIRRRDLQRATKRRQRQLLSWASVSLRTSECLQPSLPKWGRLSTRHQYGRLLL